MAREHKIVYWCDVCLAAEDRYVDGKEHTFSVDRGKEKVLTVCPTHEEQFVTPFLAAFEEYSIDNPDAKSKAVRSSRPAAAAAPTLEPGERTPCPICSELGVRQKSGGMKNIETLVVHMNRSHGLARTDAREIATGSADYELVDGGPMATVRRAA